MLIVFLTCFKMAIQQLKEKNTYSENIWKFQHSGIRTCTLDLRLSGIFLEIVYNTTFGFYEHRLYEYFA